MQILIGNYLTLPGYVFQGQNNNDMADFLWA